MTVSSTTRKAGPFPGNGVVTTFPFTFKVFAKTDIKAIIVNSVGASVALTLDSDYSVSLNADQNNLPGGTIVYPLSGTPMQAGNQLVALGALPNDQETDITNQGGFYPQVIEDMVDRATIQIQQLAELAGRAIVVTEAENTAPVLPPAAARVNMILGFDASGNVTLLPITASVGAGDLRYDTFTSGTDFTPGVTTTLNLSRAPGSPGNMLIFFDSNFQDVTQVLSLVGNVLTFTGAIPVGVGKVTVISGTTLSAGVVSDNSIDDSKVAPTAGIQVSKLAFDGVSLDTFFRARNSRVVTSIAALRALSKATYNFANVAGYYAAGDGGGGWFYYDSTDTTTADNGGTVIVASDGGRWKRADKNLNVLHFGARADGASDCLASFQAYFNAMSAADSHHVRMVVPPGKYSLSNTLSISVPGTQAAPGSFTFEGAGSDVTEIFSTNSAGPAIFITYASAYSSSHVKNFTLSATAAGQVVGLEYAVTAHNPDGFGTYNINTVTGVTFRGNDGYNLTDYFNICMVMGGAMNFNVQDCRFYGPSGAVAGVGIQFDKNPNDTTIVPVVYNVIGCEFDHLIQGLLYAGNVQGLAVVNCNFGACTQGIYAPSSAIGLDQLLITASQFGSAPVITDGFVQGVSITNSLFLMGNSMAGVRLNQSAQFTITGNNFAGGVASPSGVIGVQIDTYNQGAGVITGNIFDNMNTGIWLNTGSQHVRVQSNNYSPNCATQVTNSGTNNTVGGGSN